MNLILLFPEDLGADLRVQLTDHRARHIRRVLRARPGKVLRIGLLNGPFGAGCIEAVSEERVVLRCEWEAAIPARPPVDLLLAMPRPKVLKRLWAQFAALGVGRIFITDADKVERYYFDTHILSPEFYAARLIEGLQQARDTRLPEVHIVRNIKSFLSSEAGSFEGRRLLADPSARASLPELLAGARPGASTARVAVAIGPEGGWTPAELELFAARGFEAFHMGPRILRSDTACVGLLHWVHASLPQLIDNRSKGLRSLNK